jgi:eukaryotic-like serine/threonine-protein kinase
MTVIAKAGRYELLEEVGRGAMGVVYRAHDPVINRTVAVKTLRVSEHASGLSADELLRRFHTEARAAGLLSHPNIVAVYDAGKEDDFFYITMELVPGKSLQGLLGERHSFPLARVLRLMQQACAALEFAHQNNVVHRDIKPANLILTPDDTLKISDFGTAKILQYQTAQTGQIVGTPSYMSPEQIKGRPVDGRSDIFSLGGVLYELLTGAKPFPGDSITSVIYKIVSEDPAPPRDLDASIHPGLSAIVLRALAKSPGARFQSCVQFFDALHNYRDYQPDSVPAAGSEPSGRFAAEPDEESTTIPAPLLAESAEPAKQGNSVWLALFLLGVIAAAGYKVWPPLRDLWLRAQPEPVATMPVPGETNPGNSAPESAPAAAASDASSPASSSPVLAPVAAPAPTPVAQTPTAAPLATVTPAVAAVPESKSPATTAPTLATVAVRPPPRPPAAKPEVSQAAADWHQHVVSVLAEAGLANQVRVVVSGSTLTLAGKLDTRSHRTLLGLLQDSPANVQILDHIEDTAAPAPNPSPRAPAQPARQN